MHIISIAMFVYVLYIASLKPIVLENHAFLTLAKAICSTTRDSNRKKKHWNKPIQETEATEYSGCALNAL